MWEKPLAATASSRTSSGWAIRGGAPHDEAWGPTLGRHDLRSRRNAQRSQCTDTSAHTNIRRLHIAAEAVPVD